MNRRGFLGALGGAAVAGPSAGKAVAQGIASSGLNAAPIAASGQLYSYDPNIRSDPKQGWAKGILSMWKQSCGPSYSTNDVYMDCDLRALKSVSLTAKVQISARKQHEKNLRAQLKAFSDETGLSFLGLSEDVLLKQLKEFAGE
jgi:hypothetical protein